MLPFARVAHFVIAIFALSVGTIGLAQSAPEAGEPKPFQQSDMTLVVSVRHYLASAERSYYHLYLYSGDGKMVRRLTNAEGMSDAEPILSPNGRQVCFRRRPGNGDPGKAYSECDFMRSALSTGTCCLITDVRAGSEPREVAEPPAWYHPVLPPGAEGASIAIMGQPARAVSEEGTKIDSRTERYRSPDSKCIIVRHFPESRPDSDVEFTLVDLATSTSQRVEPPRQYPPDQSMNEPLWRLEFWEFAGPLRVVLFGAHLGSTEGNCTLAFDLNRKAFAVLAPNDGFPLAACEGVPGFFFVSGARYQELGYKDKTVNCECLDFWNEKMARTRFAPNLSKFGGAAAYIPGYGVTVIPPDPHAQ